MSNLAAIDNSFNAQNWKPLHHVRKDPTVNLKRGIWFYFLLLIFEGAIRRYIPPLSTPFLIARDPVAIWCIFVAWRNKLLPQNIYLLLIFLTATVGIFTALLVGHGNFLVAMYGARAMLFHFPLTFVIGRVFVSNDVLKMGKATLLISIPMVFLIALQFYSPQSAWINQSVGDSGESGRLTGALGFYRPPGTFSFTTGLSQFYGFVTPFVFYFLLQSSKNINKWLLIGAALALVASIPLSISRGLLFQVGLSVGFSGLAISRKPKLFSRMLVATAIMLIVFMILSTTSVFQTSIGAFSARVDNANGSEGGVEGTLGNRYLGGTINSLLAATDVPFWGYGIGMGSNVGAQLLAGNRVFLIAEDEWGRVVGELGPLLGLMVIFLRVALTFQIGLASYKRLRTGNLLPWMLFSYGLLTVSQGGWAQPTSLGFCVMIGGLMLASLKVPKPLPNTNNTNT